MTALKEFERLESYGLWRAEPDAQRREVIVFFREATLVLADKAERPLTHWSLPAIARLNPGQHPALFSPDPDGMETLEIEDDTMIEAIETIRRSVARPRPGRLRLWLAGSAAAFMVLGALFWLPGAAREQVIRTMPASARASLDARLVSEVAALTGPPCQSARGASALRMLSLKAREAASGPVTDVYVIPGELPGALALPGGTVLLDRAMMEIPEDPAAPTGHILAARTAAAQDDPLRPLLRRAGVFATLELMTTGELSNAVLAREAEALIREPAPTADTEALIAAFTAAELPIRPWARDMDITGESILPLIEAEQIGPAAPAAPLLSDGDWLSLQAICGG